MLTTVEKRSETDKTGDCSMADDTLGGIIVSLLLIILYIVLLGTRKKRITP